MALTPLLGYFGKVINFSRYPFSRLILRKPSHSFELAILLFFETKTETKTFLSSPFSRFPYSRLNPPHGYFSIWRYPTKVLK